MSRKTELANKTKWANRLEKELRSRGYNLDEYFGIVSYSQTRDPEVKKVEDSHWVTVEAELKENQKINSALVTLAKVTGVYDNYVTVTEKEQGHWEKDYDHPRVSKVHHCYHTCLSSCYAYGYYCYHRCLSSCYREKTEYDRKWVVDGPKRIEKFDRKQFLADLETIKKNVDVEGAKERLTPKKKEEKNDD